MTVLLNKIMDYFQLKLLILSIILCRVFGEPSWGSDRARYDGYDLQKGPVFYEAYYANDNRPKIEPQQFQRNIKPETQNLNGGRMMKKIYQTAGESSINSANWKSDELKSQGTVDRYNTKQKELARSNFNSAKNNPQIENQENLRLIENERFDEEYIKPILSAIENSAREILVKEFEKVSGMQNTIGNMKISRSPRVADFENRLSDGRQIIMGNSDALSRSDQPNSFDQKFESGDWKNWRANDFFMNRNRLKEPELPAPRKPFVPEKNNFQPQASNYVMSATIAPARELSFSSARESSMQLPNSQPLTPNYWPTRDFDNRNIDIRKNTQNTQKSNVIIPGVASIEVSEIPRHKIRHHHGETPRINKYRRHAPEH